MVVIDGRKNMPLDLKERVIPKFRFERNMWVVAPAKLVFPYGTGLDRFFFLFVVFLLRNSSEIVTTLPRDVAGMMVSRGNYSKMDGLFTLVNYCTSSTKMYQPASPKFIPSGDVNGSAAEPK